MRKTIYIFALFCLMSGTVSSQDKLTEGIVFDQDTKQRLTRVYIFNTRTGEGFYNNTKGEFKTLAKEGDILVSALQSYGVDTIRVTGETVLIYLKRNLIQLGEVIVRDSIRTPAEQLAQTKEEFNSAYSKGNVGNVLTTGGSNGGGGAGLSIDALYSLLSKQGRNARMLQKIIERDYRDAMIDYRYTNTLINKITGLSGDKLVDFKRQHRPGYYFILESNDYDLIQFIRKSYISYLQNPGAYRLPPLNGN